MTGFFRYPGGKSKIKTQILKHIHNHAYGMEYREPFFGGGSIGIEYLKYSQSPNVWLNDVDMGISFLWTSVMRFPDQLKTRIAQFKPSLDLFDKYSEDLKSGYVPTKVDDIVDIGFKKLAVHQMSFSGLGLSGGPLGGREQLSDYKIDCRWSVKYLHKKIDELYGLFSKFNIHKRCCTCHDFAQLFVDSSNPAFLYLDPPYYVKGPQLYYHSFGDDDHVMMAEMLRITSHKWLLSYDDHPFIRNLYKWAHIQEVDINYSIAGSNAQSELLISGDGIGAQIHYETSSIFT